jgi:hypothetical protein
VKNMNSVRLAGVKLDNGSSTFLTVNNPSTKDYETIKPSNKLLLSSGWLDTWEKKEGGSEVQIKANGNGVDFFPKEKVLPSFNSVTLIGKVIAYSGDMATIEMYGERNPKTDAPTIRKAQVKIGDTYKDIVNSMIMLEGKITSIDKEGKTKLLIQADYDKVIVL